jgi:hypothetical protein
MGALMTTPTRTRERADLGSQRVSRVVPDGTSSAVVVHLMRTAMHPDWSPSDASTVVVEHARGDLVLLRQARLRLRQSTRFSSTLAEARALATVNLAISSLEDAVEAAAVPAQRTAAVADAAH